jgi:hypothetical protein
MLRIKTLNLTPVIVADTMRHRFEKAGVQREIAPYDFVDSNLLSLTEGVISNDLWKAVTRAYFER